MSEGEGENENNVSEHIKKYVFFCETTKLFPALLLFAHFVHRGLCSLPPLWTASWTWIFICALPTKRLVQLRHLGVIPAGRLRLVTVKRTTTTEEKPSDWEKNKKNTRNDTQDTAQQTETHKEGESTLRTWWQKQTHTPSRRTQLTAADKVGFFGDLCTPCFIYSFKILAPICHSATTSKAHGSRVSNSQFTLRLEKATRTIWQ